jgi:hypothetical protein
MSAPITSGGCGMPIILNGNSGHIDSSLAESPAYYNSNNAFRCLGDSAYHYEDSAPDYFFGDTMAVTQPGSGTNLRLNYFSIPPVDDSAGVIVSNGNLIWKQHITFARDCGVIGINFGPGMQIDTHNIPDPNISPITKPTDYYWWMVKAQRYYQNPVMK